MSFEISLVLVEASVEGACSKITSFNSFAILGQSKGKCDRTWDKADVASSQHRYDLFLRPSNVCFIWERAGFTYIISGT